MNDASSAAEPRATPIALVGPTASGKTGVGLLLAEALGTEIISVDSRQVYRRLEIGTAKPTPEQRRRVRHHLVDVVEPDARFSAGQFREAVLSLLPAFREAGRTPLFVGGTGLYLQAVLRGICPTPPPALEARRWLEALAASQRGGVHPLLSRVDPAAAARIHPNDRYRAIRALEVYFLAGEPLSRRQTRHRAAVPGAPALLFGLAVPPEELKRRIAARLGEMLEAGFAREVRCLLEAGYDPRLPALRAVGYPQLVGHARGAATLAEAVTAICRETWQYARRQLTWFRAQEGVRWLEAPAGRAESSLAEEILESLRRKGHCRT